jgi:hypothetical protein
MVRRSTFLLGEQVMRSRYSERTTFLPGEQLMRSRYGGKAKLPNWRAGYEEQIW